MEQLHSIYFSVQLFQTSLSFYFFAAHERERRRQCVTRQSTPDSINTDVPFILFTREKYSRNSERLIPSMRNMAAQITLAFSFFLYNSLRQRIL